MGKCNVDTLGTSSFVYTCCVDSIIYGLGSIKNTPLILYPGYFELGNRLKYKVDRDLIIQNYSCISIKDKTNFDRKQ